VLVSNGSEQSIIYHLSDDFIVKAKNNGTVLERNDKIGLIVVKYDDGSHQAINIKPRVVKNGRNAHI
jgi:hypothetical protein